MDVIKMIPCSICGQKPIVIFRCSLCNTPMCWSHYRDHVCGEKYKHRLEYDHD